MEFNHIPVLLEDCLDNLQIKENGIYIDGTAGGAGHSAEILKRIPKGKLIGFDKDKEAITVSNERLKKIGNNFHLINKDFSNFDEELNKLEIDKVDGILLDLGVSSYQLDNAERGFSYMVDSPLDMRMDRNQELSAYEIVNNYDEKHLEKILFEYGEESNAKSIVKRIIQSRQINPITTTIQLTKIIQSAFPAKVIRQKIVSKKTFQAIRIEVNGELTRLENTINKMVDRLKIGGRMCVISFHSLEDRIVKKAFKLLSTNCICPPSAIICVCGHKATVKLINKHPIIASESELNTNKRANSAKLRVIERI